MTCEFRSIFSGAIWFTVNSQDALRVQVESGFNTTIHSVIKALVGEQDSGDVYQEAWLKMLEHQTDATLIKNFNAWFYKIAYNHAIDFRRKHQFRKRLERTVRKLPELAQESISVADYLEMEAQRENRIKLAIRWLDELPPKVRIPFVFYHADGFSFRMISDLSGIKEDTIRKRIHQAEGFLRECKRQSESE